jgi:hypothetical protein
MPISFTVYRFGRLVTYTVEGVPTAAEVAEFLDAVLAHRYFRRGFAFLGEVIASDIPHAAFTTDFAREIEARALYLAPCKWAVQVSSRAGHGLVMRRASRMEDIGVEVATFRTLDDATNWLGSVSMNPERDQERDQKPGDSPSPSPCLSPWGTP